MDQAILEMLKGGSAVGIAGVLLWFVLQQFRQLHEDSRGDRQQLIAIVQQGIASQERANATMEQMSRTLDSLGTSIDNLADRVHALDGKGPVRRN